MVEPVSGRERPQLAIHDRAEQPLSDQRCENPATIGLRQMFGAGREFSGRSGLAPERSAKVIRQFNPKYVRQPGEDGPFCYLRRP